MVCTVLYCTSLTFYSCLLFFRWDVDIAVLVVFVFCLCLCLYAWAWGLGAWDLELELELGVDGTKKSDCFVVCWAAKKYP